MEKITNNIVTFVLAYLFVFAVVQISTVLPAFSHQVPVIIYPSYIDFNTLTSAASDEVWKSENNVISIFGSAIIILVFLFLISIILLVKWRSQKICIQRILFWIAIHSFIRLCMSFICGHVFYLWGFNLVTDFIGLTFPSQIMKAIFVFLMGVLLLVGIYFLRQIADGVINPYQEDLKQQISQNIVYPALMGSLCLLVIFFPITEKAGIIEVFNTFLTPILLITLFRMGVQKKFSRINVLPKQIPIAKEKFQFPLLFLTLILSLALRIVFERGLKITPNSYDNYILENLLSVVVIGCSLILVVYLIIAYYHHHKFQKKQLQEEIAIYKSYEKLKDSKMFIYDKSSNLDKYNRAWQEIEDEFKSKK